MSQPRSDSRKLHCTHRCPGRCGRSVANHLYACGPCWRKLLAQLQRAIRTTVGEPVRRHVLQLGVLQAYLPTGDEPIRIVGDPTSHSY
jgi:hypothetical protein